MIPVARKDDLLNSGGVIVNSLTPNILLDGRPVATIGCATYCPIIGHGAGFIVESPVANVYADGLKVAVIGAQASCGCVVATGHERIRAI